MNESSPLQASRVVLIVSDVCSPFTTFRLLLFLADSEITENITHQQPLSGKPIIPELNMLRRWKSPSSSSQSFTAASVLSAHCTSNLKSKYFSRQWCVVIPLVNDKRFCAIVIALLHEFEGRNAFLYNVRCHPNFCHDIQPFLITEQTE